MRAAVVVFALLVAAQAVLGSESLEPQIVGGDEASPHQFPWQAGIWIYLSGGRAAFCGGSLIDRQWVVTAAHCASPDEKVIKFEVVLGAHTINDKNETDRITMIVTPDQRVVNPDWKGISSGSLLGDIALLRLPSPVTLNEAIQVIRLPSKEQQKDKFWRRTVTLSGWGKAHSSDHSVAPVLRYTSGKIVSNFYCNFRFFFLMVKDSHICMSGWGGKGACQGDSGGPMVLFEEDQMPTLVGVTSFGFGLACNWGWPSAYTRVTSYLDWIETAMQTFN